MLNCPAYNKICVSGDTNELLHIREFIKEKADEFGFTESQSFKICLAVDEACSNLIKYAFNFDKSKELCVAVESNGNKFEINICDDAFSFNMLEHKSPDLIEYLKTYKKGGLGIHIIKSIMDEIFYSPANDSQKFNILTLIKYKRN